jgi:tungstate transport system ATP-binding protein
MPLTPLYEFTQLTKRYGARTVLQVDALTIFAGEILALVGPSGAGKSTLLRLLNFLETPSSGRLCFQNKSFSAQEAMPLPLRRRVTTVFQHPALLHRSVAANVHYGLQLRGARRDPQAVETALAAVGLLHLANQPAHTLSGGEAQRVALARAMIIQPTVLLLDEPTANLDPHNIKVIEETVLRLNQEAGCTVVLVTHNLFQARRLAHRVALLLDGRLVEVAAVGPFFEAPTDPRTAAFVRGEMIY